MMNSMGKNKLLGRKELGKEVEDDNKKALRRPPIESLPVEILLEIFHYLGATKLFPLKLAGSHYITSAIRNYSRPSLSEYIQEIRECQENIPISDDDLPYAVSGGHIPLIHYLLHRPDGVSKELLNKCLGYAAAFKGRDVIGILLKGVSGDLQHTGYSRRGIWWCHSWTALHVAADHRNKEAVIVLLEYLDGQNVMTKLFSRNSLTQLISSNGDSWMSTMLAAANSGSVDILDALLNHGANINFQLKCKSHKKSCCSSFVIQYFTALHMTVRAEQEEATKFLLEKGAIPDLKDAEGNIPLHIAAKSGNLGNIASLLEHGSSVNVGNRSGLTPLSYAASCNHYEAVMILLKHNADIENEKEDLVYFAVSLGNQKMLEAFLSLNAPITARAYKWLMENEKEFSFQLFKMLVEHMNRKTFSEQWEFLVLKVAHKPDWVKLLLDNASKETVDENWGWLLPSVIRHHYVDVFKFLMDHDMEEAKIREDQVESAIRCAKRKNTLALPMLLNAKNPTLQRMSREVYSRLYSPWDPKEFAIVTDLEDLFERW